MQADAGRAMKRQGCTVVQDGGSQKAQLAEGTFPGKTVGHGQGQVKVLKHGRAAFGAGITWVAADLLGCITMCSS